MVQITCIVGQVGNVPLLPSLPLSLLDQGLADWFFEASKGDIELAIDYERAKEPSLTSRRSVVAYDLNKRLGELTNNAALSGKVDRIGLIFSNAFEPAPHVYGVMFDCGRASGIDRNPNWRHKAAAREGCAVFLSRIAEEAEGRAFEDEVAYTSIHEIGHVFNLVHSWTEPSFMHGSATFLRHGRDVARFLPADRRWLSQCSASDNVHPGGSLFRDCGDLAERLAVPYHRDRRSPALSLKIDVKPAEFWRFEPIELDVQLKPKKKGAGVYRVRDRLDPGYDEFRIFLTDPDGERRRFRAMRHYCARERSIVVSSQKPFERDISLFLEPGGFTFRKAGRHQIHVEFDMGRRGVLTSNTVDVRVLAAAPGEEEYDRAFAALAHEPSASCLYFRRANLRSYTWRRLVSYLNSRPSDRIAAALAYSLGRAALGSLDAVSISQEAKRRRLDFSKQCFDLSLASKSLGRRRSQKAKLLFE